MAFLFNFRTSAFTSNNHDMELQNMEEGGRAASSDNINVPQQNDYPMTGEPHPQLLNPAPPTPEQGQLLSPIVLQPGPSRAQKRAHAGVMDKKPARYGQDKLRILERIMPREKTVRLSELIESKYEGQFAHRSTEFIDTVNQQYESRKAAFEKEMEEYKKRADEADRLVAEANQKADEAVKCANDVAAEANATVEEMKRIAAEAVRNAEKRERRAAEKTEAMERRLLEKMGKRRADETDEQLAEAIQKAADAEKRANDMATGANSIIEEMKRLAAEAIRNAEERERKAAEKTEAMERKLLEEAGKKSMQEVDERVAEATRKAINAERHTNEVEAGTSASIEEMKRLATEAVRNAEEQGEKAMARADMLEKRLSSVMSQVDHDSNKMEVESERGAGVVSVITPSGPLPPPENRTQWRDRAEDDVSDLYGLIRSDDNGRSDDGDNEGEVEGTGLEVPISLDEESTSHGLDEFNPGMTPIDKPRVEREVPPPRIFCPPIGGAGPSTMPSQSQSRRVHWDDDPMEEISPTVPTVSTPVTTTNSQCQSQLPLQPQPTQSPQPTLHPTPQPQPTHQPLQPPCRRASWKTGIAALYGSNAPTPDVTPEGRNNRGKRVGLRMFRSPPKRHSNETAVRKCMNLLLGIEKDEDLKTFVCATEEEVNGHKDGTVADPSLKPMRPYFAKKLAVTWNESLCDQFVAHYQGELDIILSEGEKDEVAMQFEERLRRINRVWRDYQKKVEAEAEAEKVKRERKVQSSRRNSRRNQLYKDRLAICSGNMKNPDGTTNTEWKASYDMVYSLGASGMSSDESETENDQKVFVVKTRAWRSHLVSKRLRTIDGDRNVTSSLGGPRAGNPARQRRRVQRPAISERDPVLGCPTNYYSIQWTSNLINRGVNEINAKGVHDLGFLPGEENP